MIHSSSNPCYVSPECYKDIEISLEQFYNSQDNPFRNIFTNAKRMTQKEVTKKLDLVIEYCGDAVIEVRLSGPTNKGYVPYRKVFHKKLGEI